MLRARMFLIYSLVSLLVAAAQAESGGPDSQKTGPEELPAALDRHGDPLPPGAIARLGTVRWRPNGEVSALAYSRDGKTLVSGGIDAFTGASKVVVWDVRTGRQIRVFGTQEREPRALFLPQDGRILALGGYSKQLGRFPAKERQPASLWEVVTGKELHKLSGNVEMVRSAAFAWDGRVAATGFDEIHLSDTATGKEIRKIKEPRALGIALAFSPDGKLLASGEGALNDGEPVDMFVRLWEIGTGRLVRTFAGFKDVVVSLAFSPDGKTLAASGIAVAPDGDPDIDNRTGALIFWDVASGRELSRFNKQGASAMAFSPDGQTLAVANGLEIRFWDVASAKKRPEPPDRSLALKPVAFSPDGTILASGSPDATLIWDVRTSARLHRIAGTPQAVIFSPDGKVVAVANKNGRLSLWEVATGKERRSFPSPQGAERGASYLAFAQDGDVLAAAYQASELGDMDTIRLWDTATGKELRRVALQKRFTNIESLSSSPEFPRREKMDTWFWITYSPDGRRIAAIGHDGNVSLRDLATGKELGRLMRPKDGWDPVAFSPDGKRLASPNRLGEVLIWDLAAFLAQFRP